MKLDRLRARPGGYVLIVGDDPKFLEYYRRNFPEQAFVPLTVSTYDAAVGFLRLYIFDLVVVDEGNGRLSYRSVLEFARGLGHPSPIVVISRTHEMDFRQEAMRLGAVDCLQAPASPQEIVSMIDQHLRPIEQDMESIPSGS